jgi:hypothetical protein
MPRLIAPVEGSESSAPQVVSSPPPRKPPADDFIPRLISPAPEAQGESSQEKPAGSEREDTPA